MTVKAQILVERFYNEVWNQADENVAREILAPGFAFRGSLGTKHNTVDGFIDYMRSVHKALANYRCEIDDLITTDDRAAAIMTFKGIHQAQLLGVEATEQTLSWNGAAFFRMRDDQIAELWVLGDTDSLKRQLGL